ncbi:MAG: electron transfer flavoprotein subunit alpha [Carboxydocellales bacterium]
MAVDISKKACIGCGLCIDTCPFEALDLIDGISVVDPEKCVECGACLKVCPVGAITLPHAPKEPTPVMAVKDAQEPARALPATGELAKYQGVWVFIEQMEGQIAPVSWELLGEGRKLAKKLGVELAGVLLGHSVEGLISEIFSYGADKIYLVDDPVLAKYRTGPYKDALVSLVCKYNPEIVLIGATTLGRDLSGTVATELGTGLTADCTVLDIDPVGRYLEQTRPAFGGNIMATILCKERRPQMATVRPRVMVMPTQQPGRSGEIIREQLGLREEDVQTRVVEYIREKQAAVYLDKAEIIIAGGRGMGSAKNWSMLEELAVVLGGTVGASRAAVEAGWVNAAHQVGQTGQTVRPKVYFAIGISGAIQHLVGMQTSDTIVAINSNAEAPIFKVATYGLVGDLNKIVPALSEEFQKRLAGRG